MARSLNKPEHDNLASDIWKSPERLRRKFNSCEYPAGFAQGEAGTVWRKDCAGSASATGLDPRKRDFYAEMCRIEPWSARTLERKIGGMLFERTALEQRPWPCRAHRPTAGST